MTYFKRKNCTGFLDKIVRWILIMAGAIHNLQNFNINWKTK